MFTLVIGASASGKSEYAEKLAMSLDGQRIYLAAMEPFGQEAQARIARHVISARVSGAFGAGGAEGLGEVFSRKKSRP